MKIIALDLGTKTGFCFGDTFNGGEDLSSRNHGMKDFSLKGNDVRGDRFLKFHIWFRDLVKGQLPDKVFFEDVKRHSSNLSARVYCGLLSQVEMICVAEGVECHGIGVGTIKKYMTGNGRASKDDMIDAVKAKGLSPYDDNDADAISLFFLACKVV